MFRLGVSRERYSVSGSVTSNRNGLLQGGSVFWKLIWLPFVVMIWISWFKFNHFSDPTFRIVSNSISCGSDYSSFGSDYCSDCDVIWFRNPFPRFHPHTDFQIACDLYKGGPKDLINLPNGGFTYVISNNRTVEFFKFWYASRRSFPGLHDQDVFNEIKSDPFITKIGLRIRFLDTKYFGGFCQPSKDLNQVCTMHANCCYGLENKVHDLKILLQDWTRFWLVNNGSSSQPTSWTAPQKCIGSYHPPDSPKDKAKIA